MTRDLDNRLKRLEGQLEKLHQKIADGGDCGDIIPQFLAIKGAVGAAFELYVKESMDSCAKADTKKMSQLIKLLTRV